MKPNNQHQQVLWYLYNWDKFSLKDVINHSLFYKFQSRLSDLERNYGALSNRKRIKFTNTFGNKGYYYLYSAIDKDKVKELYNQIGG